MSKVEVLNEEELTAVVGGSKGTGRKVMRCVLSVGSAFAQSVWAKTNPYLAGANLAYNTGKYCFDLGPQKVY